MPTPPLSEILDAPQFRPHKALGQHFLRDPDLLSRIVAAAALPEGIHVIEIGAGPGGLTRALLETRLASLTALEPDARFVPVLEALAAEDARLRVVPGDARAYTPPQLCQAPRAVVGNLPYHAGTAIVLHYLRALHAMGPDCLQSMTVMLQQEVAARFLASPGSKAYGRLAIMRAWLCAGDACLDVPAAAFTPPPKVTSTVIRLTPHTQPRFEAAFPDVERVLAAAFGQRRKMLRTALKPLVADPEPVLARASIAATRRAETLSVPEVGALVREVERDAAL